MVITLGVHVLETVDKLVEEGSDHLLRFEELWAVEDNVLEIAKRGIFHKED